MTDRLADTVGKVFGRLTVLSVVKKNGRAHLSCRCTCGQITIVAKHDVIVGKTKSCGCLRREVMTVHGSFKTRMYCIWGNMKERCYNANAPNFDYYGGRGIRVAESWATFANFEEDMKQSYFEHVAIHGEANTTLDRIDPNGDYTLENCRWVTRVEQSLNRRIPKTNNSGHVGVGYMKNRKKWRARATVNGKEILLGLFDQKDDAIKARKKFEGERETYYDKPIH